MTLVIADNSDPAEVWGVHGSSGASWWKAFATRPDLCAPVEASEWACIPPAGVSGEHLHARTEEIYIVLRGHGEFVLNSTRHPVGPGSVGVTTLGNVHGLVNTGDEPLEWWVVEAIPPATEETLMTQERRTPSTRPAPAQVHHLAPGTGLDLSAVVSGPLERVERRHLVAGGSVTLGGRDLETFVYITQGVVEVQGPGDASVTANPGSSVMQQSGGTLQLTAVSDAEAYVVLLSIRARGDA